MRLMNVESTRKKTNNVIRKLAADCKCYNTFPDELRSTILGDLCSNK